VKNNQKSEVQIQGISGYRRKIGYTSYEEEHMTVTHAERERQRQRQRQRNRDREGEKEKWETGHCWEILEVE